MTIQFNGQGHGKAQNGSFLPARCCV